jgi:hypothetical protein
MGFARARGVLGQSIRSIVSWVIAMPWHPLQAERDSLCLDLCGSLEDRVDDPLSGFVPRVLSCLQGRSAVAQDCRCFLSTFYAP